MYKIIWKFTIKAENQSRFEEIYGVKGLWPKLFIKSDGYISTELLQDINEDLCYVIIDTWRSAEDFQKFKIQWQDEYDELDKQCDELTESESRIGSFIAV